MAKTREAYRCSSCGAQTRQWLGKCPSCGEWNTLAPIIQTSDPARSPRAPAPLADAPDADATPFASGIDALDKIFGGGLVPGSSLLVGGEPGVGKSTLLLQVAGGVAANGSSVLYASGEEGLPQIKRRGERLGVLYPDLMAMATSSVEDVVAATRATRPALLVVDSVQTFASAREEGLPGNVTQVKATAAAFSDVCRETGSALALVGHVTKDGAIAGPRLLEHMVDAVISFEGDRRQSFRMLRVLKNRFGPNDDTLVFRMRQGGLEIIDDPSTFFLEARDPSLSGAALVMAMEGQRPLVVEVQALVTRSYLTIPRRAAIGFDSARLNVLLAVLEKRLKLNFGQSDIYAKVGGGVKLSEPGLDLALVAAVLSSYYDTPLPEKGVFWGELDLNGQIRPAAYHERRLAQAKKLGFKPIFCPGSGKDGFETVDRLQRVLFKKTTS